MKLATARVLSNVGIGEGLFVLRLEAPDVARDCQPGQFVHIRCTPVSEVSFGFSDPLLRRPLSVLRIGRIDGTVEILGDVVGRGTSYLSRLAPGDLVDVLGPLGVPFDLGHGVRHALMIGGGIGVAPLIALAEHAIGQDVAVTVVAGFRASSKVFPSELVPPEVEYVISTDDGSAGRQGLATDVAADYLDWADAIYGCGPLPMLMAVSKLPFRPSMPVQVSMEEHMGCAMGVCLGCVIQTKRGSRRVCRDGPVFESREIDWQSLG